MQGPPVPWVAPVKYWVDETHRHGGYVYTFWVVSPPWKLYLNNTPHALGPINYKWKHGAGGGWTFFKFDCKRDMERFKFIHAPVRCRMMQLPVPVKARYNQYWKTVLQAECRRAVVKYWLLHKFSCEVVDLVLEFMLGPKKSNVGYLSWLPSPHRCPRWVPKSLR